MNERFVAGATLALGVIALGYSLGVIALGYSLGVIALGYSLVDINAQKKNVEFAASTLKTVVQTPVMFSCSPSV